MKKLLMFLAVAALTLASCHNDDDTAKSYSLTSDYLKGTWAETAPVANYIFDFGSTTATLTARGDSSSQNYNYTTQDGNLLLTIPGDTYTGTLKIEIIDGSTFKLTSLYPTPDCANCQPITSTFKKN